MASLLLAFCTAFCDRFAPGCADALVEAIKRRWPSDNPTLAEQNAPKKPVEQNTPKEPNSSCRQDKHFINARRFQITHSENPDQWKWTYFNDDSRFSEVEVAEQLSVPSLHIEAKINYTNWPLVSDTEYNVYLIFKTTKGWRGLETLLTATVKKVRAPRKYVSLIDTTFSRASYRQYYVENPVERPDKWMELKLGMFFCDDNNRDQEVVVTLESEQENIPYDMKEMKGLIIVGIELRPAK